MSGTQMRGGDGCGGGGGCGKEVVVVSLGFQSGLKRFILQSAKMDLFGPL